MSLVIGGLFGLELALATRPYRTLPVTTSPRTYTTTRDGIDPVGEEAFTVIREAMASTGTVGVSRLVLYRRERAVLLEPRGKGIVVWTLRYGDEVRPEKDYFAKIDEDEIEPDSMKLVKELIDKKTVPWTTDMVSDPVQEKLLDIISAKKKKRKRPAKAKAKVEDKPSNVVSIMDALRKSVASEKKGKSR